MVMKCNLLRFYHIPVLYSFSEFEKRKSFCDCYAKEYLLIIFSLLCEAPSHKIMANSSNSTIDSYVDSSAIENQQL